jgi:large subunit ribosomal protein L1
VSPYPDVTPHREGRSTGDASREGGRDTDKRSRWKKRGKMTRHGKKYSEARSKIPGRSYVPVREAVERLREVGYASFDETFEIAYRLGVDPKHADQMVRGTVVLPHGTGKSVSVLVLTAGEKEEEAKTAGADHVGLDEYVEKIQGGWTDVDVIVATPDVMSQVGRLGKILGPKKLMPNPKSGTVTNDVATAVRDLKAGRVEYRVDRAGNVHCPVGKRSFSTDQIMENIAALSEAVVRSRPASAKGTYMRGVTLTTTMGPGVRLDPLEVGAMAKTAV